MTEEQRTQPAYRSVKNQHDLDSLIPGDRVKVAIKTEPTWMVYIGLEGKTTAPTMTAKGDDIVFHGLPRKAYCAFLELPTDHDTIPALRVWGSWKRHLTFPGDYIQLDSKNCDTRTIPPPAEYNMLKGLANKVVGPAQ